MDCEMYFYNLVLDIISKWDLKKVGAISIWVYTNEMYEYQGINNFFEVVIGYFPVNKIRGKKASVVEWDLLDEVEVEYILEPYNYGEAARILLDWLIAKGVKDIGVEDFDKAYDEEMNYIGKGPNGYYELLTMVSEVITK